MQSILPDYVHEAVYYDTDVGGRRCKYPDHLSDMKVLQDAYKAFFDFRSTDWTRARNKDWRKFVMGPLGPSNHDIVLQNELEG